MTESNKITFVFIYTNYNFSINTSDLKFNLAFNNQDFLLEKNTIYEERKLYSNDVQYVDEILGSIDTIEDFKLPVLINMLKQIKYDVIRFKFSSKIIEKKTCSYFPNKLNSYSIHWVGLKRIRIHDFYEYSILLIILKVFNIANENFLYKAVELDGSYEIIIDNREIFNHMVLYRDNILKRYLLLLSNLQLEIDQSIYLTDLLGFVPDMSELWDSFNWKVLM
ncbi:hypothetical protein AB3331_05675 [Streptococcus sp. H49]